MCYAEWVLAVPSDLLSAAYYIPIALYCWCSHAGGAHQAAPVHPSAGVVVSEEDPGGGASNSSGV